MLWGFALYPSGLSVSPFLPFGHVRWLSPDTFFSFSSTAEAHGGRWGIFPAAKVYTGFCLQLEDTEPVLTGFL